MPITKHIILITSGGRTGTAFFGEVFDRIVSDCWSIHEPDVWQGPFDRRSWRAIQWFGLYHVTIGKLLGHTGMRCVTQRYLSGEWSAEETAASIVRQRRDFYESRASSLIVESNNQWFGLLSLLPRVFASYRVLALVRDPRNWVRSRVNFGGLHDDEDRVRRLGLPRLSPVMLEGKRADQWERMDVFQRLCWDWRFVTRRIVEAATGDPRIRLVRFEDLFQTKERRVHLDETLDFLTDFEDRRYPYRIPPGLLERRVNVSSEEKLGPWREWPEDRRRFLEEMCGEVMEGLGYSLEDEPAGRSGPDGSIGATG